MGETKAATRARNETAILEAAEHVFAEAGYRGASIAQIAERAGVPKSNITYYFQSKEALYRRVLDDVLEMWLRAANDLDATSHPRDALTTYIHTKLRLARDRPYGSKVWANEIIHGAPFIQDYLDRRLNQWMDEHVAIMEHWMDAGVLHRMEPRAIFYMIWAATQHFADFDHQIVSLNRGQPLSDPQWNDMRDAVTGVILRGIGL